MWLLSWARDVLSHEEVSLIGHPVIANLEEVSRLEDLTDWLTLELHKVVIVVDLISNNVWKASNWVVAEA